MSEHFGAKLHRDLAWWASVHIAQAWVASQLVAEAAGRVTHTTCSTIGTSAARAICQLAATWVPICTETDAARLIGPAAVANRRRARACHSGVSLNKGVEASRRSRIQQQVGAVCLCINDGIWGRSFHQLCKDLLRCQGWLSTQEQCCCARHMRACHRCTAVLPGLGVPGGNCRQDIAAWRPNVQTRTVVAEGGAIVAGISGTNVDGKRCASGRLPACIGVLVARSGHHHDSLLHNAVECIIESLGVASAQGHGSNCWPDGILANPIHRVGDAESASRAVVAENLHRVQSNSLGHTELLSTDSASTVRTVASPVQSATSITVALLHLEAKPSSLECRDGPVLEILVSGANARVQNVRVHALSAISSTQVAPGHVVQ